MSNVLGNFEKLTNKEIARMARKDLLRLGGESREATVFFCDIRSFTRIASSLKPDEVVSFLNDYLERMVACVTKNHGTIDKFIGDAVMAHWGAVGKTTDTAENAFRAVRTALMMRAALANFNASRAHDRVPVLKFGCGLNTGPLVVGLIGSEERVEFTVIGRTVAFADHTEAMSKLVGADVVISAHTWEHVRDRFICEELPAVQDRGASVRMFAVVNIKAGEDEARLLADLDALPKNNPALNRRSVGASGPQTIQDLRKLLSIDDVDLSKVVTDADEKKYTLQA
jgi:adenylate cyclase